MLSLQQVSKRYGALSVADHVTFDVPEGEALGIIGPNGAGKSTLFNLITGNVAADSGQIHYQGADVTHMSAMQRCRRGIGRSFQIPQPFDKLTVYENLAVAASFGCNTPERQIEQECVEILQRTELIQVANQPAGSLSLLHRKRLELSRALATKPKLLLLDEIAGGLTEGECQSLISTIRSIHQQGVTIVWIEHVLHALTSVVTRLLVLDFGRVAGLGDPHQIMNSQSVKEIYLGIDV